MAAERTGATSHDVWPSADGFLEDLDSCLWHQEEPFPTASIYAQWKVMELAKHHDVTVLLDGQGADEILAGYPTYFTPYHAELLRRGAWPTLRRQRQRFQEQLRRTSTFPADDRRLRVRARRALRPRCVHLARGWEAQRIGASSRSPSGVGSDPGGARAGSEGSAGFRRAFTPRWIAGTGFRVCCTTRT